MFINKTMLLGLYIHFPWCIQKCPYCDFNSHALKTDLPEKIYIQQLLKDFRADVNYYQEALKDRKLSSIFMGGGTPSLFSPDLIQALLVSLKNIIAFDTDIEITLEANPGTVEQTRFEGYKEAGVNRLSIGVQSFNAGHLKKLGRIHDDSTALQAVNAALKAGFSNFNLDLMHGLPDQTVTQALKDLQAALNFLPPHLSWYQLTLEPNTAFYYQPPLLPAENILAEIENQGHALLQQYNYYHYEISAYSQPDFECRHNLNYWHFGDYLGIGAGAHGKITNMQSGEIIRTIKLKHPKAYLAVQHAGELTASNHKITKSECAAEFMINALRLQKPIAWDLFLGRTFLQQENILPVLSALENKKLMRFDSESFEPTSQGRRYLNTVLTAFLK